MSRTKSPWVLGGLAHPGKRTVGRDSMADFRRALRDEAERHLKQAFGSLVAHCGMSRYDVEVVIRLRKK